MKRFVTLLCLLPSLVIAQFVEPNVKLSGVIDFQNGNATNITVAVMTNLTVRTTATINSAVITSLGGNLNCNSKVLSGLPTGNTFTNGNYVTPCAGTGSVYVVTNTMSWTTIQNMMNSIPKNLQGGVTFTFAKGVYTNGNSTLLTVANFYGGTLTIQGATDTTAAAGTNQTSIIDNRTNNAAGAVIIQISNNSAVINVQSLGIWFNSTNLSAAVNIDHSPLVTVRGCSLLGVGSANGYGVVVSSGGVCDTIYNVCSALYYGMYTQQGSRMYAIGNVCTNTSPANGYTVYLGGMIYRADALTNGVTDNFKSSGGQISLSSGAWF